MALESGDLIDIAEHGIMYLRIELRQLLVGEHNPNVELPQFGEHVGRRKGVKYWNWSMTSAYP